MSRQHGQPVIAWYKQCDLSANNCGGIIGNLQNEPDKLDRLMSLDSGLCSDRTQAKF